MRLRSVSYPLFKSSNEAHLNFLEIIDYVPKVGTQWGYLGHIVNDFKEVSVCFIRRLENCLYTASSGGFPFHYTGNVSFQVAIEAHLNFLEINDYVPKLGGQWGYLGDIVNDFQEVSVCFIRRLEIWLQYSFYAVPLRTGERPVFKRRLKHT